MKLEESHIHLTRLNVVIFDVDGTLYDQSGLRRKMLFTLLRFYGLRPWRYRELQILQKFRSDREGHAGASGDIENAQFRWCAESMGCSEAEVRKVVDRWIFEEPNHFLKDLVYPGTRALMTSLRRSGIKVAIYSDHKAHDKMKAMDLTADLIVSSTDPWVDRLKPDPAGLHYVARQLGSSVEECLFIGDRQEMDGECAERAGMPYLIIEKKPFDSFDYYARLEKELARTIKEYEPSIDHS